MKSSNDSYLGFQRTRNCGSGQGRRKRRKLSKHRPHVTLEPLESRILLSTFDYGDAPAPYPTLAADNGAFHFVVPGAPILGSLIDTEDDGQPDPHALGDDQSGDDDDDGVVFPDGGLIAGMTNTIEVTASGDAFLGFWIDFNGDGDWGDAGEQITRGVTAGTNVIEFDVPLDAVIGPTFARFRLSAFVGVQPVGQVLGGEVEDYRVEILPKCRILTDARCDDADANVIFEPHWHAAITYSIAAGDFNGDGIDDVAMPSGDTNRINKPEANGDEFGTSVATLGELDGDVLLFFGGDRTGTLSEADVIFDGIPGHRSITMGDFNGDGTSDILIGVRFSSKGYMFLGGAKTGVFDESNADLVFDVFAHSTPTTIGSDTTSAASMGDFNGDGSDDVAILVNQLQEPATPATVYIFFGGGHTGTLLDTDADVIFDIDTPEELFFDIWFPRSLATGDFNGDGNDDILIGDQRHERAYLYFGGDQTEHLAERRADVVFDVASDDSGRGFFGRRVAMGDFNGDGNDDVFIRRGRFNTPGTVFIFCLVSRICGRLPAQVVAQVDDIAPLRSLRTF